MQMLMGATMEVMRDFAHAAPGERNDLTIKARPPPRRAARARCRSGEPAVMTDHLEELPRTLSRPRPAEAVAVKLFCWGAPLRVARLLLVESMTRHWSGAPPSDEKKNKPWRNYTLGDAHYLALP